MSAEEIDPPIDNVSAFKNEIAELVELLAVEPPRAVDSEGQEEAESVLRELWEGWVNHSRSVIESLIQKPEVQEYATSREFRMAMFRYKRGGRRQDRKLRMDADH